MGWIRYPDSGGLQAVHKTHGEEVAVRYFGFKNYGYERAHAVAKRWLRWCLHVRPHAHKVTGVTGGPLSNKQLPYPRGVSRSICHKHSRTEHRLNVCWHDGTRSRVKTFHIGNEETLTDADYRAAERAAADFRSAYVSHRTQDTPFDPDEWRDWRETYL